MRLKIYAFFPGDIYPHEETNNLSNSHFPPEFYQSLKELKNRHLGCSL